MLPSYLIVLLCIIKFANSQRTPTISYISQEQIKNIGESVNLSCTAQYSQGYPVLWTKITDKYSGGSVIISSGTYTIIPDTRFHVALESTSTFKLSIAELQETDFGTYQCQILISTNNVVTAEVNVQVRRPPIIFDNSTRSLVVSEGQSVKLECYAGGYPTPTISWKKENNDVLPNGKSIFRGNLMKIANVTKIHRGTYFCVAENGVGKGARRHIAVEVQFAPIMSATRKRVGQALQYDMDLECRVEAYPPPAILWMKDNLQLTNNQHFEISHFTTTDEITFTVLRVITIEKRQFGNYTCKAVNIFGTSEAKIELFETIIPMCPPACN